MLFTRTVLALALFTGGCTVARAAAAADAPKPADPPAVAPASPDATGVVAARVPVSYHDVRALSYVLKDIFDVRPDRGDVRAILFNDHDKTLVVFATPAGHARVRRVLDGLLAPDAS